MFPGQGAQYAGMLAELRTDPITAATFDEAQGALGRDLATLDTAEALASTQATQIALLIVGVANARRLEHHGMVPAHVAGHSVGAFAAATHARVFTLAEALRLVELRGRLMAQAYPQGYGMAAISGVPEQRVQSWTAAATACGATLHVANHNAPDQFTVSGADADLTALIEQARAHGARASRLAVAVPSHSPLMQDVAVQMQDALRRVSANDPRFPCVANHSARVLTHARSIIDDLAQGVALPVLWHEATCALYERGVRMFVEMPPGDALTRLAQAAFGDARAVALQMVGVGGVLSIGKR